MGMADISVHRGSLTWLGPCPLMMEDTAHSHTSGQSWSQPCGMDLAPPWVESGHDLACLGGRSPRHPPAPSVGCFPCLCSCLKMQHLESDCLDLGDLSAKEVQELFGLCILFYFSANLK